MKRMKTYLKKSFIVALGCAISIFGLVLAIRAYFPQYFAMIASAERLMEIERFAPDTEEPPVPSEQIHSFYTDRFASMNLRNARFAYEDGKNEAVFEHLNLNINKGEFIAFTGESGSGKSTTLKVFLSLYPLSEGSSYLLDTNGTETPLSASWRGLFAYVPQGNQLIVGTIREVISFGDPDLMQQEENIRKALEIACADSFVDELPDGLDTLLGEHGSGLSEGQTQRLAVARAILSNRPILLLDEATSALDSATEARLLTNLRTLTDRTVIIITHREAALSICDRRIHFNAKSE